MTSIIKQVSREEWRRMERHGYTSRHGAQKYMLALDRKTGATILMPVNFIGEIPVEEDAA